MQVFLEGRRHSSDALEKPFVKNEPMYPAKPCVAYEVVPWSWGRSWVSVAFDVDSVLRGSAPWVVLSVFASWWLSVPAVNCGAGGVCGLVVSMSTFVLCAVKSSVSVLVVEVFVRCVTFVVFSCVRGAVRNLCGVSVRCGVDMWLRSRSRYVMRGLGVRVWPRGVRAGKL